MTNENRIWRACLRMARVTRELIEEKGTGDTRVFREPFIDERLITVGRSRACEGAGRKEHVVPCTELKVRCEQMIAEKASDEAIARFIRAHLKIVYVSPSEAAHLDRHLRLRNVMPAGWLPQPEEDWDHGPANVFARLEAGGITWDQ